MNSKIIALIAVIVVLGGGWWMYKSRGEQIPIANIESTTTQQVEMEQPTIEESNVKEFTITSKGLSFDPKQIEVNKGDTVRITYVNTMGVHDFVIDEFDVATSQIPAGQMEIVTFVADKAGTFEYYCSVGTHRQQGMWGMLTVKE